jgi:uncharacterized protein YbjT (DUF2867 family)
MSPLSQSFTLLILGSTGHVGSQSLKLALSDPRISRVIAPTRRALPSHPKLLNPVVDFEALPEADWWAADAAICALGTTLKSAGSKEAFKKVDADFILTSARLLREAGCPRFVLNSSLGAEPASRNFYLQVKGDVEKRLIAMNFNALTLVRPSLLDGGPRPERRYGEEFGLWLGARLGNLIPAKYRPVKTTTVAAVMHEAALSDDQGLRIIESDALQNYSTGKS